jgi:hypothetical protein
MFVRSMRRGDCARGCLGGVVLLVLFVIGAFCVQAIQHRKDNPPGFPLGGAAPPPKREERKPEPVNPVVVPNPPVKAPEPEAVPVDDSEAAKAFRSLSSKQKQAIKVRTMVHKAKGVSEPNKAAADNFHVPVETVEMVLAELARNKGLTPEEAKAFAEREKKRQAAAIAWEKARQDADDKRDYFEVLSEAVGAANSTAADYFLKKIVDSRMRSINRARQFARDRGDTDLGPEPSRADVEQEERESIISWAKSNFDAETIVRVQRLYRGKNQ